MQKVEADRGANSLLMTLVFLSRYQEARKLPPSPLWSPHKDQAHDWVTPWIALGFPQAQVVFEKTSLEPLPAIFTIELSAKPPRASLPLVHGGGHTTNAVGVVLQDTSPSTMVCTSTL
jgi:hypothetical protein